ncbi:MAG TPA: hypothetical protein PKD32_09685 [Saprospiraceae bacterium]|nr:hypothetical protein [Saprospiraceae bacterium]
MKKIHILLFISICFINIACCQSPDKNIIKFDFEKHHDIAQKNCDSLGQQIENRYFLKDLDLELFIKKNQNGLDEYNKLVFYSLGNHVGNSCYELGKKIEAYKFSIHYNFPNENVGRIISLLSITDSIALNDYTPVTQLYMSINQDLSEYEFNKVLNHLLTNKHTDNSVDYYIIYSEYSLPEERIIELFGKLIPKYRNYSSYGHMVNYLLLYSNHRRAKDLLEIEYQWMKTDSTFLKSQIAGLIKDVELKLKSE